MTSQQITISMHDRVYALAMQAQAFDLCSYLFDSPQSLGCNGIHAICERIQALDLDISEVDLEAHRCIYALTRGMLPPKIKAHNETTENWLQGQWEINRD